MTLDIKKRQMNLCSSAFFGQIKTILQTFSILSLLLISSWYTYQLGFTGGLILDDRANLYAVKQVGGVSDADSLIAYLTKNHSGPTKRPVSMLSFLVDFQEWPPVPSVLKRTNLLIHQINICLVTRIERVRSWLTLS